MDRRKPELLSPAGDMEKLRMAVAYGADAVYLAGTSFGMRSFTGNFTPDELPKAVQLAHAAGVKVHCTVNIMPRNDEAAALPAYLEQLDAAGVDALILADLGAFTLAGKYAPRCERHISTQTGIVNFAAAQVCWELGAKRVVLAREVPLSEIKGIRERVDPGLELEAFVHGAMCMSFSGRCVISNYMTGRDANRGECAQPCRWEYHLVEAQRPGEVYSLVQEEKGAYFFNSNDLRMIDAIPQMMDAGIKSLKIEGRAKSAYYVACVTAAYRRAIDFAWEHPGEPLPAAILAETEKISHRPYSHGFYFGGEPGQTLDRSHYARGYELVAVCQGREDGLVTLRERNRFFQGQEVDILQPGREPFTATLDELYNEDGEAIQVAPHAEMVVRWKTDLDVAPGAYLRVKKEPRSE